MDFTKVPLKNMSEDDLIDIAAYMKIPQNVALYTAFDGGLVNIAQLIDAGNSTIARFACWILANVDPHPALVKKIMFHLNICRSLYGDVSRFEGSNFGGMTNVHYVAKDEFMEHLKYIRSLIPFTVNESFIDHHTAMPRHAGRG